MINEAFARIKTDRQLQSVGWNLEGGEPLITVEFARMYERLKKEEAAA
jgi:hypothetical protein